MMADHFSANVVCPFYLDTEKNTIRCEGIGGAASLHMAFLNRKDVRSYQETYCADLQKCGRCPVFGMLRKKYE